MFLCNIARNVNSMEISGFFYCTISASNPGVSLDMRMSSQRKQGKKQRERRRFASFFLSFPWCLVLCSFLALVQLRRTCRGGRCNVLLLRDPIPVIFLLSKPGKKEKNLLVLKEKAQIIPVLDTTLQEL